MAEAIVSMVVGRISDLLSEDSQVLHGVKDQVEQVVAELMRMKTFLRDADSRIDEERIRILLREVRDLAYDAEHVVETFIVKASTSEKKRRKQEKKYRIKIQDVQRKRSVIYDRFRDCNIKSTLEAPQSSNSSHGQPEKLKRFHTFTTVEPHIFVAFQGDVDRLVGLLVDESDDCYPLISICGMGGLGKTTLAEKIYNHSTINTHFAGLAWVSVSQKWQTKLVLQRILISLIHERKDEILKMDDDMLVENLQQIQQKKKCLIVLDDIWSTDAWDSLKAAFTAERSLSKLMITSRNVKVAEHASPKGFIHQPECLSAEHSWELLRLKALPEGYYLDNIKDVKRREEIGREMLSKCAGLPLAIVILGGFLVTKPSLIEWEKVYRDSLFSLKQGKGLEENQQRELSDILLRSYNDLPPQLKPCFLYFGKFMEDEWIDAETLYQLWIAEGIVLSSDKQEGETMMQVAESYMGELVHRSMVQVRFNLESSFTKFKSCSVHDHMRDISLSQAKTEDFFEAIDLQEGNAFHFSMIAHTHTRQLVVYCGHKSRSKNGNSYIVKKPHQEYRSMLLMNVGRRRSLAPVVRSHLSNLKLLRVLALENVILHRQTVSDILFGTDIRRVLGNLVYLRYLSARKSDLMIFQGIEKLVMLQTLKLDQMYVFIPEMSNSHILGKLVHLRHLYLPDGETLLRKNIKPNRPQKAIGKRSLLRFNGLSKLETLDNFNTQWCEVKDLPTLTSLQILGLSVCGYNVDVEEMMKYLATLALSSTSCLRYLALDLMVYDRGLQNDPDMIRQLLWDYKFILQELKIHGELPELSRLFEQQKLNHTHFDVSLIRITTLQLSFSYLEEDPMPVLEKILTLRDLKLLTDSYMGKEMVCSSMGFPRLTGLELFILPNLVKWKVEEGSMYILQHLEIGLCENLEELPHGLIFLKSLRKLILSLMPLEFCDRVRTGTDFYKIAHVPDLTIEFPLS